MTPISFAVMSHKFTEERDDVWFPFSHMLDSERDDWGEWAKVFDDFCACYYAWDGIT